MGKQDPDPETGIAPSAKDGDPGADWAEDEIARRKQLRDAREDAQNGRAIDSQQTGEEDDGQLFVWEQGRKVTLGTLIARGVPVEHAFVFGGKRLKGRGGLVSFDDDVLVIARGKVGKTALVPTRNEDEGVTKVVIETHIAVKVVTPADSEEGLALLGGVFERRGIRAA